MLFVHVTDTHMITCSTKRILACVTVSRREHTIAQTRELEATKAVLPQALEQGGILLVNLTCNNNTIIAGLKIVEVAHDNATSVKKYITEDLRLLNSYDTWHGEVIDFLVLLSTISVRYLGTKNVAKSMKKISCGTKKAEGKSWFVELSDKCKS